MTFPSKVKGANFHLHHTKMYFNKNKCNGITESVLMKARQNHWEKHEEDVVALNMVSYFCYLCFRMHTAFFTYKWQKVYIPKKFVTVYVIYTHQIILWQALIYIHQTILWQALIYIHQTILWQALIYIWALTFPFSWLQFIYIP